ncbi:hypothetical protein JCM11641_008251 [Rhodosporidiobolus odoratus]
MTDAANSDKMDVDFSAAENGRKSTMMDAGLQAATTTTSTSASDAEGNARVLLEKGRTSSFGQTFPSFLPTPARQSPELPAQTASEPQNGLVIDEDSGQEADHGKDTDSSGLEVRSASSSEEEDDFLRSPNKLAGHVNAFTHATKTPLRVAHTVSSTSPTKTTRQIIPFDPSWESFPDFHILNYAPMRHPNPPPVVRSRRDMRSDERIREFQRSEAQQKLREREGQAWEWSWKMQADKVMSTDRKGKGKEVENSNYQSVAFFPFAHHAGMDFMDGVFAVCGDDKVCTYRSVCPDNSSHIDLPTLLLGSRVQVQVCRVPPTSTSSASSESLVSAFAPCGDNCPSGESFHTLAWSVDITTRPYTPVLAVAGKKGVVEVYLLGRRSDGRWILHHERTITGHGGDILHLSFHPNRPHLLASCSIDYTIRLVDVSLPWGSNAAMVQRVREDAKKALPSGALLRRRRVEGELLAIANRDGHRRGVLCCDFHPNLPLMASCGMDGHIKLWHLPPSLLSATPSFPSSPLQPIYKHPAPPPAAPLSQAPSLAAPIFSSHAVHPGQWPTSVRFVDPTSVLILSTAPVSHPDARFSPRKSVKFWTPFKLDLSVSQSFTERDTKKTTAKQRTSRAFRVAKEVVLESQDCIGDRVGWFAPSRSRALGIEVGGADEPFLVVPSTTSAHEGYEGLYFYRPFASTSSTATKAPTSSRRRQSFTSQAPAVSGSLTPLASGGDSSSSLNLNSNVQAKLSTSLHYLSLSNAHSGPRLAPRKHRLAQVTSLFPPDRDRHLHDFHPRLLPSFIAPVPLNPRARYETEEERLEAMEREDPERMARRAGHLRGVAVEPGKGRCVVAVGEVGVVVWRARSSRESERKKG